MDRTALSRATDPSSAPTPGYLYNDIAKSLTSPQACSDTLAYLLSRLSKTNPHVKKKSLKVLSKIVSHPASRGMMKRAVVTNPPAITSIKEAISHRGSTDAVTGDQANLEVREAARECLDAVYSDAGETSMTTSATGAMMSTMSSPPPSSSSSSSSSSSPYGPPMGGHAGMMGGAGPSGGHHHRAAPSSSSSSSTMQGIGNPMFADPRLAQQHGGAMGGGGTALGALGEMASNVGGAMLEMIKDPLARNVDLNTVGGRGGHGHGGGGGGYNPDARPDPYAQNPPGRNNLTMQTGGQWTMASNRGPNAVGGGGGGGGAPSNHLESEYYKARNAQQGGQAFSWAGAAGGGGAAADPRRRAPPPPLPSRARRGWEGPGPRRPRRRRRSPPAARASPRGPVSPPRRPGSRPPCPSASEEASGGGGVAAGGGGGAVGEYERNLILELCPPGGMKAEPPQEKLEEFARAVPSLNPDVVCPALLDALEEGNPWIMRAKALCVIETVLRVEAERTMAVGGGVTPYTDFFHACSAEIEPLADHARVSVKAPAKRVLTALGVDGSAMGGSSANATAGVAQAPVAPPPTPPPNLLDFDEPSALDGAAAPVAAAPAPPAADYGSSVPTAGGTGGSLFSGLNTKAASAPVASTPVVVSPPSAALPSTSGSSPQQDDLLGGMGADASVAATGSFSDFFGNMAVKSDEAKVDMTTSNVPNPAPADAAPAALPGSAFGFMNPTPASPGLPLPVSAVSPAPPSAKLFDPLLGMGMPMMPNGSVSNYTSNNTFIAPSPNIAQMQLAYQQNMIMMQQMQMQQQVNSGVQWGTPQAMPTMSPQQTSNKPIMGANYMRQVPGVSGEKISSFSFLGEAPKKKENKSFDFVMDAMKSEKK